MTGGGEVFELRSALLNNLVTRIARREPEAFGQFHDLMRATLFRKIRRELVDLDQSAEVLQEVWLEIWQTADRFSATKGDAVAWASVIAKRRAIDRVRASESSRRRDFRIGIRDWDPAPSDDVFGEQLAIKIAAAAISVSTSVLTPVQRQAIELVYLRSYSLTEAAALAKVSYSSMRTRVRDGLIRLRKTASDDGLSLDAAS